MKKRRTSRRTFLKLASLAGALPIVGCAPKRVMVSKAATGDARPPVNDIHSQINATRVERIEQPSSLEQLRSILLAARAEGKPICIAGGRHAMEIGRASCRERV